MEEKDPKKSPEKKSESPPHINNKEEDINKINKLNLTEQVENNMKRKSFITKKLTKEFVEEEEEKEINIKYKEHGKKMVAISLDLLLKKIVNENFLEENPIKIYSFCQQCFCFIERDILFNKIFNCYDYYKNKKITMSSFCKLIKFLNVLVIEMFDYYITTIKLDDPIVRSLDDFYRLLLAEIIQIINDNEKEKEDEKNSNPDFNSKEFQNIIEDEKIFNENLISKDNTDLIQNRNCIYSLDEEKEPGKRERFNTLIYKNKDNANIKKEQNKNLNTSKNNNISDDKTKNNQIKDTYKIKLKPETKKENKHFKNTNNKKEEKKGSKNVLLNIKKEKPVKLQNKNDKEKEKEKITPNINRINAIKKETNSIEKNFIDNEEQKDPKNIKIKLTKHIYIDTMNNNEGREKNKYHLGMNQQGNFSHSKEDIDYKIEKLKEKKNNNNKESRINREIKEYIPRKNIGKILIHNSFSNNYKRVKRKINSGNNQYVINDSISKNNLNIKNTEQIKDRENERKMNNQQENNNNKNVKSIGVGNTNKRKEIKISNEMKNNVDYSMIHNQFSFNSIKKTNKKSNILEMKNNNKLTILNIIRKNEPNKNESNKNDKKKVYKISPNVVNEQYYGNNFIEKEMNNDEEDILSISIQSLNDSKIMEIAKRCIEEEDDLNKNEIKEILNCKKDRLL